MASGSPPSAPICTYINRRFPVRFHDHIALLHRDAELGNWGAEFISEGLARGDRCCCLTPARCRTLLEARLGALGVAVERHLRNGSLVLLAEAASPAGWMDRAKALFAGAQDARVPAVRWFEAATGDESKGPSADRFFECHAMLNYFVKHYPCVAVCEYAIESLKVQPLFSVVALHRHLVVRNTLVRDNPYYIPAEKFISLSPEDRERDLRAVFRAVGFDLEKLLSTLAGYGRLQGEPPLG